MYKRQVQKDTEQAKALMKEVDSSLTYNTDLEDAASRLADWLVEDLSLIHI